MLNLLIIASVLILLVGVIILFKKRQKEDLAEIPDVPDLNINDSDSTEAIPLATGTGLDDDTDLLPIATLAVASTIEECLDTTPILDTAPVDNSEVCNNSTNDVPDSTESSGSYGD
jgi:hypothetical protein